MSAFLTPDQEHELPQTLPELGPPRVGGFGSRPVPLLEQQRDKTGAVTGLAEGKARAEYFQTARMANDPALAEANDQPVDAMAQMGAIPQLLEAQKRAREGGKHADYQAKRAKFEHEVGLLAAEDPQALGTMKAMCEKAKDWIAIMGGGKEAFASLAQDSATGYGGAVGQSTDPKDPANAGLSEAQLAERREANAKMMETIMSGGGNVREMAMALQNFQTMMAKDMMDPEKRKLLEAEMAKRQVAEEARKASEGGSAPATTRPAEEVAAAAEKTAASLSPEELGNIMGRFDQTGGAKAADANSAAKALFSPTKAEKAADGRHGQFGAAKSEDHDTKLPPMPSEAVEATRNLQAAQDSVDRATTQITTLTGQRAAASQAALAADRQVADLEARVASAPDAQKASLQAQLTSARSQLVAKNREIARLDAEINQAKSALEIARGQLTQARATASQPAAPGGKSTKGGEKSPMAWSTEKVVEQTEVQPDGQSKTVHVSETGIKLSENEVAAMKRSKSPATLPMIEGVKANIIDSSAPFITEANAADMPLKSGISGTTFRFMEMAELMGQPPENARLAMIGHLTPIGAHSIHEINTAASGFGSKDADKDGKADAAKPGDPPSVTQYDTKDPNGKGGPYTPEKMKPLTVEQLTACALKAGFASLKEANEPPPDANVAATPAGPSTAA